MVKIDSGELPSAIGKEGYDLTLVVHEWQKIAHGRFPDDCSKLLQMIEETDRLELWKKRIGGFTFESRNEFLQKKVLINFDLTATNISKIISLLERGEVAAAQELFERAEASKDRQQGKRNDLTSTNFVEVASSNANPNVLRRLARDHEAIFEKVKAGELSVNAAAIEAGIRKKPTPEDTCLKAFAKVKDRVAVVKEMLAKLTQEEVASLLQ